MATNDNGRHMDCNGKLNVIYKLFTCFLPLVRLVMNNGLGLIAVKFVLKLC